MSSCRRIIVVGDVESEEIKRDRGGFKKRAYEGCG
jgi:hypothetical protein